MTMMKPLSEAKPPELEPQALPAYDSDWRVPPHTVHDDPLLGCLVDITRLHGNPHTPQALSAGLPLVNNRLTPSLLARAAARAHHRQLLLQQSQGIL